MLDVILVDDNTRTLDGLRRHIPWDEIDCTCVGTAANGLEALELCRLNEPDVVITDVRMPFMDGLDLSRELRQRFPGVHVIILSAYDEFEFAHQALLHGVEDYILKPIDSRKIRQLAGILARLSAAAKKKTIDLAAFYSSSIVEDLAAEITGGSEEKICEMIRSTLSATSGQFDSLLSAASHLVAELYRKSAELGLPERIDGRLLAESLTELQAIHSIQAVIEFVTGAYLAVHRKVFKEKKADFQKMAKEIMAYIEANYTDPEITTFTIARHFHISQSYLCQVYKQAGNDSIHNTITRLRIERAAGLLHATDLPINEVARMSGYPDAHYFARVFKKLKKLPPSELRKLRK